MLRSLLIAVRFQEGRYHGQQDGFNGENSWPPSPGRLFQALVAASARGATISTEDKNALKWLEKRDPPKIAAPPARRGQTVRLFVPNNDLDSVDGDPTRVSEIRVLKQWSPCFFDSSEPVLYVWDFDAGETEAMRICVIAERLYQLGRGIDMAWATGYILERNKTDMLLTSHPGTVRQPQGAGKVAMPHSGTLDSLVARHQDQRIRLKTVDAGRKPRQLFTKPPKASLCHTGYDTPPHRLYFELRNLEGRFAPSPLAAAASLITILRDAAANRLQQSQPEKSALFERLIIGRNAGPADLAQRIRLIPIPSVGTSYTDPSIRRIVVEVPPDCPIRADDLQWAFSGLELYDLQVGESQSGRLVSTKDIRMMERFSGPARIFRSVTPVALSRIRHRGPRTADKKTFNKRSQQERRAVNAIIQTLRHASISVSPIDIHVQREPFNSRGERAEMFAAGTRFSKEMLWHAAITFAEPVIGPLLLGDGRYLGLGLMLPDETTSGVLTFTIETGLTDTAKSGLVAHAARRAMMARVQQSLGRGQKFPSYVSGHQEDGSPARAGIHRHIAVVADLQRQRILYIAPNRLQRGSLRWNAIRQDHLLTERALEGMDTLRAGEAGRLVLARAFLDLDTDPMFAPAKVWENITNYRVTRHRRNISHEDALKIDVLAELRRCGWPDPKIIEVLAVHHGPRGGLAGRLRLIFSTAQTGPLLLGRTAHKGGGLFANSS